MASIGIIGDGPGGLSAALFLAKNGHEAVVYGTDQTAMNHAYLYNYLGLPEIDGTEFQRVAKAQVAQFGVTPRDEEVTAITAAEQFGVATDSGRTDHDYLILSEGTRPELAKSLGVDVDDSGTIVVDRDYRTSMDRVYVVGRSARPKRSQAIISAGAGATAALDILAIESGQDVQDWDSPPDENS